MTGSKTNKGKYNYKLLKKCFDEDCAIDMWVPEKITRDSRIKFICFCGKMNEIIFRYVFKTGMKCYECKLIIADQKARQTNLEKRGCEYPGQCNEVKNKIKEKNITNFGVVNVFQSEEIKQKSRQTNMKKRGVEHSMQDPEVFEKGQKNRYRLKSYTFPSGKKLLIHYENFALDKLLTTYSEEEIIVGASLVPKIIYQQNNKNKRYFPDIYINKDNLIIEVKSTYTIQNNLECNLAKRNACIEQGFDYKFWIFDKKGNLIQEVNKDEDYIIPSK